MVRKKYNLWMGILVFLLIILIVALVILEKEAQPKLTPQEREIQRFAKCVVENELQLYGKNNSQIYLAQREEFGAFFDSIPFVDCLENREQCEGILLVPAWRINEQIYYGSFSKDVLTKLLGCK